MEQHKTFRIFDFVLFWSSENDAWLAVRRDPLSSSLKDLTTHGDTPWEALREMATAMELEAEVAAKDPS